MATSMLWRWTPGGYTAARALDPALEATVLTPRSTAQAILAGYVPVLHPSGCREGS